MNEENKPLDVLKLDYSAARLDVEIEETKLNTCRSDERSAQELKLLGARKKCGSLEMAIRKLERQLAADEEEWQQRRDASRELKRREAEAEKLRKQLAEAEASYRESGDRNAVMRASVIRRRLKELEP